MGNYKETKEEVRNNLFARVPLVVIHSSERERVERMLRELAAELKTGIFYYTDVKQVISLNGSGQIDVNQEPLRFAQERFRKNRGTTFVLGDAMRVREENAFSREILDTLYLAMETSGTLVLVTPDYVWNRLAGFGLMTRLDYPDSDERMKQISQFVERYRSAYPISWSNADIQRAAMMLRGFSEIQIDNILVSQLVSHKGLEQKHLQEFAKQKSRLYAAVPCVDEVRINERRAAAGMDNLRDWLRERKQLFFLSDEILSQYGLTAPKGILLAGVPGCGKSFSARLAAQEWELPLFRFDIGSIYDKWMGESERKMQEALTFLDNMAPCVVWIDEVEKALAVSDSGNDTGKRILGQFLYWLQESTERVFLVATANDISKLPPELFRKGRFSEIFFVDLPNRRERKAAIEQYMNRCLHQKAENEVLERLVNATEGYSYADIEEMVKEAAQYQLLHPEQSVGEEVMLQVIQRMISFAESNPDTVESLRKWGKHRAAPASRTDSGKEE
ncbi:MAG: AAA family ATPase [Eubacteriales bacterium]|nr:AAA family ATPase [Eubacteriales bacterium]